MASIKSLLAQSPALTSVPSNYVFTREEDERALDHDHRLRIPTIDFSLLASSDLDQRSRFVAELGEACRYWGFFMLTNHGVPKSLIDEVIEGCREFFDLSEEEKAKFEGKHALDPIRYGTSFNASADKVLYWRDYLKVIVHPHFNFPNNPSGFSDVASEYCQKIRAVVRGLAEGVSESLGLEGKYIEKTQNLESGFQVFAANLYPPCPQPHLAMGLPPHSDQGLFTLLVHNGITGLQIQHQGKWLDVNAAPNSLLVNTCDHLTILSNGKYKSVVHRAVVNSEAMRISLAIANGPSLDTIVSPAPELLRGHDRPHYRGIEYKEFLQMQQKSLDGKPMLDRLQLT